MMTNDGTLNSGIIAFTAYYTSSIISKLAHQVSETLCENVVSKGRLLTTYLFSTVGTGLYKLWKIVSVTGFGPHTLGDD